MEPIILTYPLIIKLMTKAIAQKHLTESEKKLVRRYFATLHANEEFFKLHEDFMSLDPKLVKSYMDEMLNKLKAQTNENTENYSG